MLSQPRDNETLHNRYSPSAWEILWPKGRPYNSFHDRRFHSSVHLVAGLELSRFREFQRLGDEFSK